MTQKNLEQELARLREENAKLRAERTAAAVHVSPKSGAVHLSLGHGKRPVGHHVDTWDAIVANIQNLQDFLTPEVREQCAKLRKQAEAARG
jgi:hypothetical protein